MACLTISSMRSSEMVDEFLSSMVERRITVASRKEILEGALGRLALDGSGMVELAIVMEIGGWTGDQMENEVEIGLLRTTEERRTQEKRSEISVV